MIFAPDTINFKYNVVRTGLGLENEPRVRATYLGGATMEGKIVLDSGTELNASINLTPEMVQKLEDMLKPVGKNLLDSLKKDVNSDELKFTLIVNGLPREITVPGDYELKSLAARFGYHNVFEFRDASGHLFSGKVGQAIKPGDTLYLGLPAGVGG